MLSVSTGAKEKGVTAGIAIGAVIALEAMFAGPICGASMNPARSLAPAIVSGHFEHLWLYLAATCPRRAARGAALHRRPRARLLRRQMPDHSTMKPPAHPHPLHRQFAAAPTSPKASCAPPLGDASRRQRRLEARRLRPSARHPRAWRRSASTSPPTARSTSTNSSTEDVETVITVCGNADQACPMFPGQVNRHHWGFDDPAHATGTRGRATRRLPPRAR